MLGAENQLCSFAAPWTLVPGAVAPLPLPIPDTPLARPEILWALYPGLDTVVKKKTNSSLLAAKPKFPQSSSPRPVTIQTEQL